VSFQETAPPSAPPAATLADGLSRYRADLGIPDDVAAVNAGSWGPLCRAARLAMTDFARLDARLRLGDHSVYKADVYEEALEDDRRAAAGLVGCSPDEVALCESTTTAMNIIMWGLGLEPGDEIVSSRLENPAAVVPLRTVATRRGLQIRWLDFHNGAEATDAFERTITSRTRLLLLSDVDFAVGSRVELGAISSLAHEHGVFVLADGAQAVGTTHVDVRALGVDAYAFARHKFLCGPDGGGVLYLKEDVISSIAPTFTGVFSDAEHGMAEKEHIFASPQRFEVSTRAVSAIAGATAATMWIHGIGMDVIADATASRRKEVRERLKAISRVRMISPSSEEGGLLTFAIDGMAPGDLLAELAQRNVFGRTIVVTKPHGVRLSIGFWTRDVDVDAIERAVHQIAARVPR
jgi:selenocysteine lyase/cysteine desulfurase